MMQLTSQIALYQVYKSHVHIHLLENTGRCTCISNLLILQIGKLNGRKVFTNDSMF